MVISMRLGLVEAKARIRLCLRSLAACWLLRDRLSYTISYALVRFGNARGRNFKDKAAKRTMNKLKNSIVSSVVSRQMMKMFMAIICQMIPLVLPLRITLNTLLASQRYTPEINSS